MTAPTRLICQPWITLADLPASKPDLDDEVWEDLTWQASELLYLWSGRQYPGGCASTVVLESPPGASSSSGCWRDWEDPWVPRGDRGVRAQVVALPDSPVTSVDAVVIGDVELVADVDYTVRLPVGLLKRTGGRVWPTDGSVRVTYRHGLLPPIGGQRAATLLTLELGKDWATGKCELPKRVVSVARQGLSYDMAPAEWGTNIWAIDSWLLSVNPGKVPRRASAWSPDAVPARRTTT